MSPSIPSTSRRGTLRAGFSLLELIVVMSILAILSVAIVPVYGASIASLRIRNASSDFRAMLSFVQQRAVAESREYRVYIDPEAGCYWAAELTGEDLRGEKEFTRVAADFGREACLPENLKFSKVKARKDRGQQVQYIGCYPNGASDRVEVTIQDLQSRKRRFKLETLGAMGKFKMNRTSD